MFSMLDQWFLTPLVLNAIYLPIAIDSLLVHTLFNTGKNFTLINRKPAEQIDLNVEE